MANTKSHASKKHIYFLLRIRGKGKCKKLASKRLPQEGSHQREESERRTEVVAYIYISFFSGGSENMKIFIYKKVELKARKRFVFFSISREGRKLGK